MTFPFRQIALKFARWILRCFEMPIVARNGMLMTKDMAKCEANLELLDPQ